MRRPQPQELRALRRQWAGAFAALCGFVVAGIAPLPNPPFRNPEHLLGWWAAHTPVVGAVSLLRWGGIVCGAYWLVLCSAALVAGSTGHLLASTRLRLPGYRRLVRTVTGGSLVGVTVVCASGCTGLGAGHRPVAVLPPELVPVTSPATAAPATTAPTTSVPLTTVPTTTVPTTTMPTTTVPTTTVPPSTVIAEPLEPAQPPELAPLPATPPPAVASTSWTVRPGDDLWSISESVLRERLGRQPAQSEIAALWLRVLEVNRQTLADPENPNLIFAGDVVAVPG